MSETSRRGRHILVLVIGGIMGFVALAALAQSTKPAKPTKPTSAPVITPRMEAFAQAKWDVSQKGRPIDLSQYKQTFNDDFKTMDIVKEDTSPAPEAVWFSPGHGAYETSAPLRKDGPFALVADGLRCRVETVGKKVLGACMTTVNTRGEGFAQQYGYFESTMDYKYDAKSPLMWGAFWLKSQKDYSTQGTATRTEIDVVEFYGDDALHSSMHLWPADKPQPGETVTKHIQSSGMKAKIAPELFKNLKVNGVISGFHSYGGEVTPEWVIIYFDRKEVARFPTQDEWKTPLYMLVDVIGRPAKGSQPAIYPIDMIVKNVSAFLPKEPYKTP